MKESLKSGQAECAVISTLVRWNKSCEILKRIRCKAGLVLCYIHDARGYCAQTRILSGIKIKLPSFLNYTYFRSLPSTRNITEVCGLLECDGV